VNLLSMRGVGHRYRAALVLEGVDLDVESGDFLGIVGPSGSGKSTLLRILTGALVASEGEVRRARGLSVAYVPQVETVHWDFPVTVSECVLMARTSGRRLPWRSRAEQHEVDGVLGQLGLDGLGDRHIRELSGGQQQRVFLARALLRRPDVVFMDEPTSGVDVKTRHEVLHLLGDLNLQGVTMVLTTHDLNGLAAHLPHLVCLNRRVIAAGTPAEVITPAVLEATYGARMEVLQHAGLPVVVEQVALRSVG
jgi:ABC-type Mn2+/Zn2+ transport system ATPase subunit